MGLGCGFALGYNGIVPVGRPCARLKRRTSLCPLKIELGEGWAWLAERRPASVCKRNPGALDEEKSRIYKLHRRAAQEWNMKQEHETMKQDHTFLGPSPLQVEKSALLSLSVAWTQRRGSGSGVDMV